MAEVKHTPGPWNTFQTNGKGVETPGGVTHWVKAGEGYGHVGDGFLSVCIGGSRDAEANARLIAAAPDLFEAGMELQAARKAQNADPSAKNALRVRAASDAFDTALSKATAQQEGS